jgi:hypothetical protein
MFYILPLAMSKHVFLLQLWGARSRLENNTKTGKKHTLGLDRAQWLPSVITMWHDSEPCI